MFPPIFLSDGHSKSSRGQIPFIQRRVILNVPSCYLNLKVIHLIALGIFCDRFFMICDGLLNYFCIDTKDFSQKERKQNLPLYLLRLSDFMISLINRDDLNLSGCKCAQVFNRKLIMKERRVWLLLSTQYQGLTSITGGLVLFQRMADTRVFLLASSDIPTQGYIQE